VLISSHVLAEVAQAVDRVVIVSGGRLVAAATLDELVRRSAGEVRVRSREAERLRDVLVAGGVAARPAEPELVVATGATAHPVGQAAADSGIALYRMTSGRADLEAVFLELTRAAGGAGMRNLLRAELLKMRTIRVTYGRPATVGRQVAAPGRGPGPRPGDPRRREPAVGLGRRPGAAGLRSGVRRRRRPPPPEAGRDLTLS
jgi:ABC-type glutathione transport system ATPase component